MSPPRPIAVALDGDPTPAWQQRTLAEPAPLRGARGGRGAPDRAVRPRRGAAAARRAGAAHVRARRRRPGGACRAALAQRRRQSDRARRAAGLALAAPGARRPPRRARAAAPRSQRAGARAGGRARDPRWRRVRGDRGPAEWRARLGRGRSHDVGDAPVLDRAQPQPDAVEARGADPARAAAPARSGPAGARRAARAAPRRRAHG